MLYPKIATYILFLAPMHLPLGLSPLVTIHRLPSIAKTTRGAIATPLRHTPLPHHQNVSTPKGKRGADTPPRGEEVETESEDVSSPVASRATAAALNEDYAAIRTPVSIVSRKRNPAIPLQRTVLLSTG